MVTVPSLVDETPLNQYTATASQTDFNFTYMIFATEDIKVYVNGVLKTETTDYVVKQSDGSAIVPTDDLPMDGGKVVFNSGLTSGDEVSLSRDIAIERLTGYSVAGAFRADVVNAEFTKLYAVQQQLERDISRSLRLSDYDAEGGTFTLPENRASKFLAFDASGNMIASAGTIGTTAITVSSFMETVLDDTTAAAARTTLGVAIGSDIQAYDADLTDIAGLTVARGDLLIGDSTPVWSNLTKGSANYLLKSDGTDVSWGFEVLDEDDMVSDSATKLASQQSIKAYVDSKAKMIQVVNTQTGAVASSSANIPYDDTIPQNTEGSEYMTLAITPTDSNNKLLIQVIAEVSNSSGANTTGALFQDSTANALAASISASDRGAHNDGTVVINHYMTAGTTSSTSFKVRLGGSVGTTTFNGVAAGRKFGGVSASSITITEIQA